MNGLRDHKHLALLVTIVIALVVQPLLRSNTAQIALLELLSFVLLLVVFLVVLEGRRERIAAAACAPLIVAGGVLPHAASGTIAFAATLAFHGLIAAFLGFAVGVILRRIFLGAKVGTDEILGGVSGYLLAGVAFGNLYVPVYLLAPDAFVVAAGLSEQLAAAEPRRALFNYFSIVTLTTIGYGDITPAAPMACALACLEAIFGQFYLAVLIGQLIGMKLAQNAPGGK